MPQDKLRVLAINPGSTSTKIGVYTPEGPEFVSTIRHADAELAPFAGGSILAQKNFRFERIRAELQQKGIDITSLHAVVGRGGLLPPLSSGTYIVDDDMLHELELATRGEHASNLGAFLALEFARNAGVKNAYIVDPVSVDEWQDCARISGSSLLPRTCLCHALNTKAVAKRFARETNRDYSVLRLVILHLGSGISVSAHRDGKMIDNNTGQDGPFAADRSGTVPALDLIKLCFSGKYTQKQVEQLMFGSGGLASLLGTRDLVEVERRISAGDEQAKLIFETMLYQAAKEAGAMATVLHGKVDAVLFTGGMANSKRVVERLSEYLNWIAPIKVYPGEDELLALSEGAFRVLRGEEQPRRLRLEMATHSAQFATMHG